VAEVLEADFGRADAPEERLEAGASDVGQVLAEIATGPPQDRASGLAGPELQLVDMARRALEARGESARLVPSWRDGPVGVEMAGEVLSPGPGVRRAPTTFDAWLAMR
jgi:hypothetical protein